MTTIRELGDMLTVALLEDLKGQQPALLPDGMNDLRIMGTCAQLLLDHLAVAVAYKSPEAFSSFLDWASAYFGGFRFPDTAVPGMLSCARQVLSEQLPEATRGPALQLMDAALAAYQRAPAPPEPRSESNDPIVR